ncbi:cytotoxic T-lymphocyte protein 4-like isoform X1 [Chiloscyllium plagiosum]|uniref:cytotoxic T-lymphocyte protein 4-like isoform X1 n=2 Tax=Chiloscyllium plagiosum TaxID=36176 RepID=UPI001CB85401|nr:cytotoxic T-lymphocyte protein 4-like isoform X1 [Chiloscyllium plagiosum]
MNLFSKVLIFQLLLSVVGNSVILMVTQSPPYLSAMEGGTATMTCWINSSSLERRIEWSKVLSEQRILVLSSKGNITKPYLDYTKRMKHFLNDTVSTLSIFPINRNDTGVYVCEVLIEIPPPVYRMSGNGTHLQVQVVNNEMAVSSNDNTTGSTWILIGCILSIILIVSVTTSFLARKLIKKEEPMYVNVRYRNKTGENKRQTETKCEGSTHSKFIQ